MKKLVIDMLHTLDDVDELKHIIQLAMPLVKEYNVSIEYAIMNEQHTRTFTIVPPKEEIVIAKLTDDDFVELAEVVKYHE